MIIWNDYQYGRECFLRDSLKTKKWQYKELKALIFYMMTEDYSIADIKAKMDQICQDDIKYLNAVQKDTIFSNLINQCKKDPAPAPVRVIIYQEEIDQIATLPDKESKQLIFFMLVYKKWLDARQKKAAPYYDWFACMKQDMFTEANLNRLNSAKRQKLLSDLIQRGFLCSEVKKLTKSQQKAEQTEKKQMWSIPFLCRTGKELFVLDQYDNVVNYYLNYAYGGFFTCKTCCGLFEKSSNRQLYCLACKKEKQSEKYKKYRENSKKPPFKNGENP